MWTAVAALAACLLAGAIGNKAGAIIGGEDVRESDVGARSTIILLAPKHSCSGVVYADSFILTTAHCLLDSDLKAPIEPHNLKIIYARSLNQPGAAVRPVSTFVVHENFVKQIESFLSGTPGPLSFSDYPINHEDIAVIRVTGGHPDGAVSATLPEIANDFVYWGLPKARLLPLLWMDVYGFGSTASGKVLHKLRVSAVTPDIVRTRKDPVLGVPYFPRQIMVKPDELAARDDPDWKSRGICHGDSGGPAFFVTTENTHKKPDTALKLVAGRPIVVGLMSRNMPMQNNNKPDQAAGDECSNSFYLVRTDYYREWILSRIKQMR
jgi:hypothetical protein